jgi:hypothetical protein
MKHGQSQATAWQNRTVLFHEAHGKQLALDSWTGLDFRFSFLRFSFFRFSFLRFSFFRFSFFRFSFFRFSFFLFSERARSSDEDDSDEESDDDCEACDLFRLWPPRESDSPASAAAAVAA